MSNTKMSETKRRRKHRRGGHKRKGKLAKKSTPSYAELFAGMGEPKQ